MHFIRFTTIVKHPTTSTESGVHLGTIEEHSALIEIHDYEFGYGMPVIKEKLHRVVNSSFDEERIRTERTVLEVLLITKI